MVGMAVATTVASMEERNMLSMMPIVTRMMRFLDMGYFSIQANFDEPPNDTPIIGYLSEKKAVPYWDSLRELSLLLERVYPLPYNLRWTTLRARTCSAA